MQWREAINTELHLTQAHIEWHNVYLEDGETGFGNRLGFALETV